MNKKGMIKNSIYVKVILFLITLAVMFLSVGYSALSATGRMENIMASFSLQQDARITDILPSGNENGGISNSEGYNANNIYGTITLPNSNSSVTYKVSATVFLGSEMKISSISGLDSHLEYELTDYQIDDILCNTNGECNYGATKDFYITIKYKEGFFNSGDTTYAFNLDFTFEQASFTARIGNDRYDTLQKALDAVPANNTETEVILLKNTSEDLSITANKNVVFNLQNYTISNVGNNPVIENYGTLKISNGTLTSSGGAGVINNESGGNLTVSGGSIIATGTKQAIYNNGGTLLITGDASLSSTSNQRATVQNQPGGTITITGGTISSTRYAGVINSANLTIGIKDGNVNKTKPDITGATYGVSSTTGYNYYDGVIRGKTSAVENEGVISDIEVNKDILHENVLINNATYHSIYLAKVVTVTFNANTGNVSEPTREVEEGMSIGELPIPTKSGYDFLGWFTDPNNGTEINSSYVVGNDIELFAHWINSALVPKARIGNTDYTNIQSAINASPNNTETTITVLANTRENLTIRNGKRIILDLQNYTLSNNGVSPVIENYGVLKINNGTITSNTTQGAINNESTGTLYMTGGSIVATGTRQAIYNNGGTTYISGTSNLSSVTTERGTVQNLANGTINITGGNITSTGFAAIVNVLGTINYGEKDGTITSNSPVAQGKTYGIDNSSTLNFYDGTFKGKTSAINGSINDMEQNSQILNGTETINSELYYTATLQ